MSDAPLLEKTITITEVQLEEKRIKIVADGKVFSIWRTKKDGTPTVAYTSFEPHAMSATGKTFVIKHDENPNPQNEGTFYRTIMTIALYTGQPSATVPQAPQATNLESEVSSLKFRLTRIEQHLGLTTSQEPEKPVEGQIDTSGEALADKLGGTLVEGDPGFISADSIPF